MEKKQSSIEWLEWQINLGLSERGLISALKEAKAMHKEEIEFSYNCGWADGHDEATSESPLFTTGEEYYNETFGETKN